MNKNSKIAVSILAICACFLWSTAFAAVKIALQYFAPLSTAGMRFILSGIILIPFCGGVVKYVHTIKDNFKLILVLSLFQTVILYGSFFIGLDMVPGALGAIVIGSSPLIAAIISHFMMHNDRMTPGKIGSILLGMVGIIIISLSRKPWEAAGLKEMLGISLLVGGSIFSIFANIIIAKSREKKKVDPLILNSSQILLGGLTLFIISLFIEGPPNLRQPLPAYGALLWLATLSAVAFSIWFILLNRPDTKVSELNLWKFIIPVFGAVLSWILLPDESPTPIIIIGMFIVALSILLYSLIINRRGKN